MKWDIQGVYQGVYSPPEWNTKYNWQFPQQQIFFGNIGQTGCCGSLLTTLSSQNLVENFIELFRTTQCTVYALQILSSWTNKFSPEQFKQDIEKALPFIEIEVQPLDDRQLILVNIINVEKCCEWLGVIMKTEDDEE